jgi:hypothetical protein
MFKINNILKKNHYHTLKHALNCLVAHIFLAIVDEEEN